MLRLQAVAGPDGITVMRGGVGRVLAAGRPAGVADRAAREGRVGGRWRGQSPRWHEPGTCPQVDFGASVPKRAADALFWMARAAERAEVAAHALRVVGAQLQRGSGAHRADRRRLGARCARAAARRAGRAAVDRRGGARCDAPAERHRARGGRDADDARHADRGAGAGGDVGARVPVRHDRPGARTADALAIGAPRAPRPAPTTST